MEWIKRTKVGDKVVCIKDNWQHKDLHAMHGDILPKEGDILTIRTIDINLIHGVMFRFMEIVNPPLPIVKVETQFVSVCFKPLQKGMTDLYDLLRNPDKIVDETKEEKEKFFEIS